MRFDGIKFQFFLFRKEKNGFRKEKNDFVLGLYGKSSNFANSKSVCQRSVCLSYDALIQRDMPVDACGFVAFDRIACRSWGVLVYLE